MSDSPPVVHYVLRTTVSPHHITDPYDHVHHADILKLLEQARLDFLVSVGTPHEKMLEEGYALVITRIDIQYKREVKLGAIEVTVEDMIDEGREFTLRQTIFNERRKVCVAATVHSTCMSLVTRRGIALPDKVRILCGVPKGSL